MAKFFTILGVAFVADMIMRVVAPIVGIPVQMSQVEIMFLLFAALITASAIKLIDNGYIKLPGWAR